MEGEEGQMLGNLIHEYAKERIHEELEKFYKETIGDLFPSIFGELPLEIIKAVVSEDKFWEETIFVGFGNYIHSKREAIGNILDLFENDYFVNLGPNIVETVLKGHIADSEIEDFMSEPINWLRGWLQSADPIIVTSSANEVRETINKVIIAILLLIVLSLLYFLVFINPKSKLNTGQNFGLLLQNLFNNIRYNDKTVTGGLIKGILNVVDSWVNGDEDRKFIKNVYILLNEIRKVAKSLSYLDTSLDSEYSVDELRSRQFKIKNKRINDELTRFVSSIGKNAGRMTNNILKKGGLWNGDMMDYVLADLILARIHVKFEGEKAIFTKREGKEIIDWTDEESRKQHPLSKTIKNLNKISKGEIEKDVIRTLVLEYFQFTDKEQERNIGKTDFFTNEFFHLLKNFKKEYLKGAIKEGIIKQLSTSNDRLDNYKKQLSAIRNQLTFKVFYEIFNVDFVVSGSNITSGQPVYFNHSITPSMPVVTAVRISSNFPFLFQPIKIAHTEKEVDPKINYANKKNLELWVKDRDSYYKKHYHGFFIDGGMLNNLPMNAFNKDNSSDYFFRDPKSKFDLPPNNKVFGLKLESFELNDSKDIDKKYKAFWNKEFPLENMKFDRAKSKLGFPDEIAYEKFINKHKNKDKNNKVELNNKKIGMLSVIVKMYGTTMDNSMDGRNSAFFDKNEQIVRLYTGQISLFDLVTKEKELILVDLFSYSEIFKHFDILGSLEHDWEENLMLRLKRNRSEKNKWKKNSRNRKRLRMRRRHH